ncbi:GH32 C-terminal domain-containing protein [Gaoshiqia sediminis]|uniref:beta-fructofuranosidase n=1 Tax=Gaoshiqia sediminis TaxID=2986998 RepID=A0AA41Y6R8_9BACT|nr:GH32 C-terminal domain-containing protein [Gaoshiqia sediminis]MCW0484454.1 GH32 C-terminal domain-containing protein [Gaoshiqia sediminis]
METVSGQYSVIRSFKTSAEFVAGISGTGLRTDGYSTFINAKFLNEVSAPVSLEGWFALETYPTDTAGFFAIEQDSANWISACINQFGEPMISVCNDGKISWYPSNTKMERFKWLNVILSVSDNKVVLFLNGERLVFAGGESFKTPDSFTSILIGRDTREKKIHIFPVTYINGIIDEVKVWNRALSESDLNKKEIELLVENSPSLAIPEIRFEGDFNRPKYHILPAANWTNETHGLIYYKGKYHIFNQKNGNNVYLGQINWGHFSSPDLMQWTEHRPVLTPEPGYDQLGIWSGHAVIDDSGTPAIMYTGGNGGPNGMCLAFPKDSSLIEWEKYNGNPVVDGPPQQYTRKDFRDPYVWKENDTWYMIVGFGIEEDVKKGTVLLYQSSDLKNWEYLHPLFTGDPANDGSGIFWEMPVFWKMNGKYILSVNPIPYDGKPAVAIYWVGDFVNYHFVPDHKKPQKLEVINRMLSPSVALDEDGQTTAIAIIPDLIPAEMQMKQGWTHLYSIPRTWDLVNGKIYQQPHPAIQKLRKDQTSFPEQEITPGKNLVVSTGKHQLEIIAKIVPQNCERFGFNIGKNAENGEVTPICFDLKNDKLLVDLTHSSKNEQIYKKMESGDYKLNKNEPVELHLFIDGSVVEGFINGKDAFTTRIFPEFENSNEVELFSEGGNILLKELMLWGLKSSSNQTDF